MKVTDPSACKARHHAPHKRQVVLLPVHSEQPAAPKGASGGALIYESLHTLLIQTGHLFPPLSYITHMSLPLVLII